MSNNENDIKMKRVYFPPQCEMTNYELETFILANSIPQIANERRGGIIGEKNSPADKWGNLWQ